MSSEFGDGDGLWLGQSDVKDAFHRLGMQCYLSRYFSYFGCTAEELKMVAEVAEVLAHPFRLESMDMSTNWGIGVNKPGRSAEAFFFETEGRAR